MRVVGNTPVFDPDGALAYAGGSHILLGILLREGLSSLEKGGSIVHEAYSRAAWNEVAHALGVLKETAAIFRMDRLSHLANELFWRVRSGERFPEDMLAELRETIGSTQEAVRRYMESAPRLRFERLSECLAALRNAMQEKSLLSLDCAHALREFCDQVGEHGPLLRRLAAEVEAGHMWQAERTLQLVEKRLRECPPSHH